VGMKIILLFFFAYTITHLCFAQSDFRNGFIITNSKDTIRGMVDYREGARAYKLCNFQKLEGKNVISYQPGEIIGYGFNNDKFFESRQIEAGDQIKTSVFLEVLITGFVSLFKYDNHYYIEKKDGELYKLEIEYKVKTIESGTLNKKSYKHIGILNMLLYDCIDMQSRSKHFYLSEKSLVHLVEEYNSCKNAPVDVYKINKPWVKLSIGLQGGLNVSNISFEVNDSNLGHLRGVFTSSKSPALGLSMNLSSPRLNERISFQYDFIYSASRFYSFYETKNDSRIEKNYIGINLKELKVPIGIRYTFPERKLTPFCNFGVSSIIHLNANSDWIQEIERNRIIKTYDLEKAFDIRKRQSGLWAGFGILKSIKSNFDGFCELRYEVTNGVFPYSPAFPLELSSHITNFQILIGIRTK